MNASADVEAGSSGTRSLFALLETHISMQSSKKIESAQTRESSVQIRNAVGMLMVLCLMPAFARASCSNANEPEDKWFHDSRGVAPAELFLDQNRVEFVVKVLATAQKDAQRQLSATPAVHLSLDDVKRLTGKAVQDQSPKKYFLLRGLSFNWPGDFLVNEYNRQVSVTYSILGNPPDSAKRTAIVALLSAPPEVVYVTCSGGM
jgi:hypothetical protein